MSVSLGAVVLHVSDVGLAAEFWSRALGFVADPEDPAFLVPPGGEGTRLHLDAGDRTHLDLWVDRPASAPGPSATELDAEVQRLIALGARRIEWPYPPGADHVVLADPDGNVFCVIP
jgi:catechol 2,3-dioxygenase-like lactoylglutathione lyase family enzyme